MKKGVQKLSNHTPSQAPPLTREDIHKVISHISTAGPDANVLVTAILLAYNTLLKQGNLLQSTSYTDPGHALRARDVTLGPLGITVMVNSTTVSPRLSSACCLVSAWDRYSTSQRPHRNGPAFLTPGGAPLQPSTLVTTLRLALDACGHPNPTAYTLHSLHTGQALAAAGGSLQDIMNIDACTSSAVHTYVPRDPLAPST